MYQVLIANSFNSRVCLQNSKCSNRLSIQKACDYNTFCSRSSREVLTSFVRSGTNLVVNDMIDAGVDWIARDLLSSMVTKAQSLVDEDGQVIAQGSGTYIVASQSNVRMPHIVNVYPNGMTKCDSNCPAYASQKIYKHTLAVNIKEKTMAEYFRWFVSSQRRSGGINLSKAIIFGMPEGRVKKGNRAPRKKSRRVGETITTMLPRLSQHPQSTSSGLQHLQSSGLQQQQSSGLQQLQSPALQHPHFSRLQNPQSFGFQQQQPSIPPGYAVLQTSADTVFLFPAARVFRVSAARVLATPTSTFFRIPTSAVFWVSIVSFHLSAVKQYNQL